MRTAVLVFACLLLLGGCERRVAVPGFRGVVLDARTGEPICGATIRTMNYRAGAFNLEASRLIRDSDREVTSREDGRFELPGFADKEISGVGWLVYAPGYMVGSGCYSEANWPIGGCSGFGLTGPTDPWVRTKWERGLGVVDLEVRLFPPTNQGVTFYTWVPERQEAEPIPFDRLSMRFPSGLPDPWEEHLDRLSVLVQGQWRPTETFIDEANRLQEADQVPTRRHIDAIRSVAASGPCDCSCASRLLVVSEALCAASPTLGCGPEAVARWRYLLELRCSRSGR